MQHHLSDLLCGPYGRSYWITLDLNGGELDGNTGVIKEQYVEKTVITYPRMANAAHGIIAWNSRTRAVPPERDNKIIGGNNYGKRI